MHSSFLFLVMLEMRILIVTGHEQASCACCEQSLQQKWIQMANGTATTVVKEGTCAGRRTDVDKRGWLARK